MNVAGIVSKAVEGGVPKLGTLAEDAVKGSTRLDFQAPGAARAALTTFDHAAPVVKEDAFGAALRDALHAAPKHDVAPALADAKSGVAVLGTKPSARAASADAKAAADEILASKRSASAYKGVATRRANEAGRAKTELDGVQAEIAATKRSASAYKGVATRRANEAASAKEVLAGTHADIAKAQAELAELEAKLASGHAVATPTGQSFGSAAVKDMINQHSSLDDVAKSAPKVADDADTLVDDVVDEVADNAPAAVQKNFIQKHPLAVGGLGVATLGGLYLHHKSGSKDAAQATEGAVDPTTGLPVDPNAQIDPATGQPVATDPNATTADPNASTGGMTASGYPKLDPNTMTIDADGNVLDRASGQPNGLTIDVNTGLVLDSTTGAPTGQQLDLNTGEVLDVSGATGGGDTATTDTAGGTTDPGGVTGEQTTGPTDATGAGSTPTGSSDPQVVAMYQQLASQLFTDQNSGATGTTTDASASAQPTLTASGSNVVTDPSTGISYDATTGQPIDPSTVSAGGSTAPSPTDLGASTADTSTQTPVG